MCSFVKASGYYNNFSKENLEAIEQLLNIKGGDEYNVIIKKRNYVNYITWSSISYYINNTGTFANKILNEIAGVGDNIDILFFSRLTPEMEVIGNEKELSQPYYNPENGNIVVVHGTIPNAESIAEKYGFNIKVDTEIFYHLPFDVAVSETELVNGKISAISLSEDKYYHNGLGLFTYEMSQGGNIINIFSNIKSSHYVPGIKPIDIRNNKTIAQGDKNINKISRTRVIALFSGGLDITCSVQKIAKKYRKKISSIDLWYFDWGTNARNEEIIAGKNFRDLLDTKVNSTLYPEEKLLIPKVNYTVLPVESAFKNILEISSVKNVRLIDNTAEGAGSHEAESAISYVPYRNTLLLTMAAARAEQLYPNEKVIFVLGANLSEGMIYLDNSEPFIDTMNDLVKLGGQKSMNFFVEAPYVNRTKTEMVTDALLNAFDLTSYSCYFPKDNGSECGECGSCLLKQNAIERGHNGGI